MGDIKNTQERLDAFLNENPKTFNNPTDCCKSYLKEKCEKEVDYKPLNFSLRYPSIVYLESSHYKASICTKSTTDVFTSFAFSLIAIEADQYGILVKELDYTQTEHYYKEHESEINKIAELLKKYFNII